MRKFSLLSAAAAAVLLVTFLLPSAANADGTTTISAGPAQYQLGLSHPTGTISIGGGTISARCAAASVKGAGFPNFTPNCTTRVIHCPLTATSCTLVSNLRESAFRGPVEFFGIIFFSVSPTFAGNLHAYDCPQATTCSWKTAWVVPPGTSIQSAIYNLVTPNYPSVFDQQTLTIN